MTRTQSERDTDPYNPSNSQSQIELCSLHALNRTKRVSAISARCRTMARHLQSYRLCASLATTLWLCALTDLPHSLSLSLTSAPMALPAAAKGDWLGTLASTPLRAYTVVLTALRPLRRWKQRRVFADPIAELRPHTHTGVWVCWQLQPMLRTVHGVHGCVRG